MKNKLIITLAVLWLSGCAAPAKLYEGPEQPSTSVAQYYAGNYAGFTDGVQIYTIGIDSIDLEKNPIKGGAPWLISPGDHMVKITFNDTSNYLLLPLMTIGVFQGWYEVKFTAKPGKAYAPIFNMNLSKDMQFNEMCIAEISQGDSLSDTRVPMNYAGCAKPNIQPTEENIKLCQKWDYSYGRPLPVRLEEFCNHNIK